jgi:hypothetical protein
MDLVWKMTSKYWERNDSGYRRPEKQLSDWKIERRRSKEEHFPQRPRCDQEDGQKY